MRFFHSLKGPSSKCSGLRAEQERSCADHIQQKEKATEVVNLCGGFDLVGWDPERFRMGYAQVSSHHVSWRKSLIIGK